MICSYFKKNIIENAEKDTIELPFDLRADNLIFCSNPKQLARETAAKLNNKESLIISKTLCKRKIYTVIYKLSVLFTFYKNKTPVCLIRDVYYRKLYTFGEIENLPENIKHIEPLKNCNLKKRAVEATDFPDLFLKDEVYVGVAALNYYRVTKIKSFVPEVISDNITETLKKFDKYILYKLPMFSDVFLMVAVAEKNNQKWLIYNSAEYEIITYNQTDRRIAGVFVSLRFLLVSYYFTGNTDYIDYHNKLIKVNRKLLPKNFYGINKDVRFYYDKCVKERDFKPYLTKLNKK